MKISHICFSIFATGLLCSCSNFDFFGTEASTEVSEVPKASDLKVSLSENSNLDQDTFSPSYTCMQDGGTGKTPAFVVHSAPKGTNAILIAFNLDNSDDLNNGGLGVIGYAYEPSKDGKPVVLPSVKGETTHLTYPAFLEKDNLIANTDIIGYAAPCRKTYGTQVISATITAVKRTGSFETQKTEVLGTQVIPLGELGPSKSLFDRLFAPDPINATY